MFFFYKSFKYCTLATVVSFIGSLLGITMVLAFLDSSDESNIVGILIGAAIIGIFGFLLPIWLNRKLGPGNVYKKVKYAKKFCEENPESIGEICEKNQKFREKVAADVSMCAYFAVRHSASYPALARINPRFGAMYEVNAEGKVVMR